MTECIADTELTPREREQRKKAFMQIALRELETDDLATILLDKAERWNGRGLETEVCCLLNAADEALSVEARAEKLSSDAVERRVEPKAHAVYKMMLEFFGPERVLELAWELNARDKD